MEFKLPLLVSTIASTLSFTALATPSPIVSGQHIQILAEDVYTFGQLFNASTVAATNNRVVYANTNGYVVTAEIGTGNTLTVASTQVLPNTQTARFTLSEDGNTLVYVATADSGTSTLYVSAWNNNASQWEVPTEITPPHSVSHANTITLEGDLLAVAFSNSVQFYRWNAAQQSAEFLTDFATQDNAKVHSVKNSSQFFIENTPASANGVLGQLIDVNSQSGDITDIATLSLSAAANTQFLAGDVSVFFDRVNHVVALAGKGAGASSFFYRFADTRYDAVADAFLPNDFEGVIAYQNGVLVEANSSASQRNVYLVSNTNTLSFEKIGTGAFSYDANLHISGERAFSDNFATTPRMGSRHIAHFSIDRVTKTFTTERYYTNGMLEPLSLASDDFYQPTQRTENHWLIFPHDKLTYLVDKQDPTQVIAESHYDLLTGWSGSHTPSARYLTFRNTLFAFLLPSNSISDFFNGRYDKIGIDKDGNFSQQTHYLSGDVANLTLPFVKPFPIPSLNGIAVLDPSRVLFYQYAEDGPLQHIATRGGNFPDGANNAVLLDDGLGILFVSPTSGLVKRLRLSGNVLTEQNVTFDVTPPLSNTSTAVTYGPYLSIYAGDSAPFDTHTYRRDASGNFELYFVGDIPCDCIVDEQKRLTDTQAFDVQNGRFTFYELDLTTKQWTQVESLSFSEDIDVRALAKTHYYGKSAAAVRNYAFNVVPALTKQPDAINVEINTTQTIDLASYITDANLDDVHQYRLLNPPEFTSLTGSILTVSPTTNHESIALVIQVTDSSNLSREFILPIVLAGQPVVRDVPPRIVGKHIMFNGTLTENVYDPDGLPLTFTTAADSALPVTSDGLYVGSFDAFGTFVIKATATDAEQHAVAVQQTILVNAQPVARSLDEVVVTQGATYSGSLAFAVSDADGDALTFTTANNSALSIAADGSFSGVMADTGRVNVSAIATDAVGQTVTVSRSVFVNAAPVALNKTALLVAANSEMMGSLTSNVTDADGTSLVFSTLPDSALAVGSDGSFSGSFPSAGVYTISARATDEHGASVLVTQTIVVSGDTVFSPSSPTWVNPQQSFHGDLSQLITDVNGETLIFTTAAGSALSVQNTGEFSGNFDTAGRYEVRGLAQRSDGSSVGVTQIIRVNHAPKANDFNDIVAKASDKLWVDIGAKFTDADDQPLTITAANLPQGLILTSGGILTGNLDEAGEHSLSFTATDSMGLSASAQQPLRITTTDLRTRPARTELRAPQSMVIAETLFQSSLFERSTPVSVKNNRVVTLTDNHNNSTSHVQAVTTSTIDEDGNITILNSQSLPGEAPLFLNKIVLSDDGKRAAYLTYDPEQFRVTLRVANWHTSSARWVLASSQFVTDNIFSNIVLSMDENLIAVSTLDAQINTVSLFELNSDASELTKIASTDIQVPTKFVSAIDVMAETDQIFVMLDAQVNSGAPIHGKLYTIDRHANQLTPRTDLTLTDAEQAVSASSATAFFFDRSSLSYFYYAPQINNNEPLSIYRLREDGSEFTRLDTSALPTELQTVDAVNAGILVGQLPTGDYRAYAIDSANSLGFSRMAEVPFDFIHTVNNGWVSDEWAVSRASNGTTVYAVDKTQNRIVFKNRHKPGELGGATLSSQHTVTELAKVSGLLLIDNDAKTISQLSADGLGTLRQHINVALDTYFGTTVATELHRAGDYLYATYHDISFADAIDVNVLKIGADEHGNLQQTAQRLLDADGNPLTLNVFRFYAAPSMGGLVVQTDGKLMLYQQNADGSLSYSNTLAADFTTGTFMDDGKGLTYWNENSRRLDRIRFNTESGQLELIASAFDITPPQATAYAEDGILHFRFIVGHSERMQIYTLNAQGRYERKFAGNAPCADITQTSTIYSKDRAYCYSADSSSVTVYYLDKLAEQWQSLDTIQLNETLLTLDKHSGYAYGTLGSWVRRYQFDTAPIRIKALEPISVESTVTVDLASYVEDTDSADKLSFNVVNLPENTQLTGAQLNLTASEELDGYRLKVAVTDAQQLTTSFELPVKVNHAPVVNNAPPLLIDKHEAIQGSLATLVVDPDGDTLTFIATDDSALPVSTAGDFQGTFSTFGIHTIKATASDDSGASVDVAQHVIVNSQPQSQSLALLVVPMGDSFSGSLASGATDEDGDQLLFSTNADSDFAITADGDFNGSATTAGLFTASALATDPHGRSATATQTVKVNASPTVNPLPPLSVHTGHTITGNWASAVSDANGDALIFTSAADSALPVSSNGAFSGIINTAGTVIVKGTVSDIHGATTDISQAVIVTNAPVTITMEDVNLDNGGNVSLNVATQFPTGETLTFTATGLPSGITLTSDGMLSGSSSEAGEHAIQITATTAQGVVHTLHFTLNIAEKTTPPPSSGGSSGSQSSGGSSGGSLVWLLGLFGLGTRIRSKRFRGK